MRKIKLTNCDEYCLVDDEDYPLLNRVKWCKDDAGYVRNGHFRMHSLIMGFPRSTYIVDHINGNKLDNRKSNLRLVTYQQNSQNVTKRKGKFTSEFKGAHLHKNNLAKPWESCITKNYKSFKLGHFENAHQAALMYDFWSLLLFGKYAKTNFKVIGHNLY